MEKKQAASFVISQEDWSLHRKGHQDGKRHMDKVKKAIKKNLPDLITEENIIMSNGRDVVKIPVRSLDEYKLRYNHDKQKHIGQGDGDSKIGDVVARSPDSEEDSQKAGDGHKAGNQPGQDYYETEVSVQDIAEELFEEMELPDLEEKEKAEITTDAIEFNDIRKKGLMGNIDKKRTILSAIKRNAREGKAQVSPILDDDLRFKTWNEIEEPQSKAVIIAMMDTSASMGNFEKYLARSFFFWLNQFLKSKYQTVEMVFIAHHTEASVVKKEAFFTRGESGGTICSSAYRKALEVIHNTYSPDRYNIYAFHFSDGENLASDNDKCVALVEEIMKVSNMFGYGEINSYDRYSTLMTGFKEIDDSKFRHYILKEEGDVYEAMKSFFRKKLAT